MKSNKTLIIILVSVFILAAIGGLVFYLLGNNDTTDEQTTPETSEEKTMEADEDEADETDSEEVDGAEEETGVSSVAMKAQELLDNLVASNDRMEALVAECDLAAIDEEAQTFLTHNTAAFTFIEENRSNPDVVAELADFPDQVNAQIARSETFIAPTANCRAETT